MKMGYWVQDEHGEPRPATLLEWGRALEDGSNRVAFDDLGALGQVSTVFLGLDHNWHKGPPEFWETMIFGGPLHGEMDRYTSRAAAIEGHAHFVALCKWEHSLKET